MLPSWLLKRWKKSGKNVGVGGSQDTQEGYNNDDMSTFLIFFFSALILFFSVTKVEMIGASGEVY